MLLVLQEQVRQKASDFFQETDRFRQFQSSIEELLLQVQIQYGCKLLKGHNNGDNTSKALLELQQMTSLSTCGHKFKQYESLVFNNL